MGRFVLRMSLRASVDLPVDHNNFDESCKFEVDTVKRNQSAVEYGQTPQDNHSVVIDQNEAKISKGEPTKDEQVQTSKPRLALSRSNHQPKYQYKAPCL